MIKVLAVLICFITTTSAFAEEAAIQCDWIGSKGLQVVYQKIDLSKNYEQTFTDPVFTDVKFSINFSSALKTIDSSIRDEKYGVEAYASEWSNDSVQGAHSAVRLTTKKGSFTLSCSIH